MLRGVIFALAALCAAPASAAATSPADQIAALNEQREANGIPAGIVEVPAWSEGCRKHMEYVASNGGTLTHEESPVEPRLHRGGGSDRPAGRADAARGRLQPRPATRSSSPRFTSCRSSRRRCRGWACGAAARRRSRASIAGPSRPSLYTYPGEGAASVYASERAFEMPFVPGDFVGLPQGTTTGPHIYLMPHGAEPGADHRARASPDRPARSRSAPSTTPRRVWRATCRPAGSSFPSHRCRRGPTPCRRRSSPPAVRRCRERGASIRPRGRPRRPPAPRPARPPRSPASRCASSTRGPPGGRCASGCAPARRSWAAARRSRCTASRARAPAGSAATVGWAGACGRSSAGFREADPHRAAAGLGPRDQGRRPDAAVSERWPVARRGPRGRALDRSLSVVKRG